MAILHGKQRLLCDKKKFHLTSFEKYVIKQAFSGRVLQIFQCLKAFESTPDWLTIRLLSNLQNVGERDKECS